jgi:hypothetical protein
MNILRESVSLFLLAGAKAGFTRKLLQYARPHTGDPTEMDYRLAWFSGPHGQTLKLGNYGSVIMVATGLGIAAQLPYLKELIKGYNNCNVRTRRIQLIWQIATWGEWINPTLHGHDLYIEMQMISLELQI